MPADYNDTEAGSLDIAYIRYLVNDKNEDIMYNPGGPGGSGVQSLQDFAPSWSKRWPGYNFVSFDPRGVGLSEPQLDCQFPNSSFARRDLHDIGDLQSSWDLAVQKNEYCYNNTIDTGGQYVGTAANVMDMMYFTELQAGLRKKDPSKALINYYGISYGTLMGQTLVAMFPDRLRRVLLDGNVYGVAHYQGWEPSSADDVEHGVWLFSKACYEAGEENCGLSAGANSTDDVKATIDYVIDVLRDQPGVGSNGKPYTIEEYLGSIRSPLMRPKDKYTEIDSITQTVLDGILNGRSIKIKRDDVADEDENPDEPTEKWPAVSQVSATDGAGRYPWKSYAEWHNASQAFDDVNPYGYATFAASFGLMGAGKVVEPPASQKFPGFENITPSAKVLFINTSGDPVTPAASCRDMSKLFAGSGVVIVEGPGHGYEAAPSKCAYAAVDNYWKTGDVPAQELSCEMDVTADYFFAGNTPSWLQDMQ